MSCFVMVRRASGSIAARLYPACRSSISFHSIPFRSSRRRLPRAACPWFRAYRVRAPASARARAGARILRRRAYRAPDCACARGSPDAGRTSPASFSGLFSRRRETGNEAAPGMPLASSCPIVARNFRKQVFARNYFKYSCEYELPPPVAGRPQRPNPVRGRRDDMEGAALRLLPGRGRACCSPSAPPRAGGASPASTSGDKAERQCRRLIDHGPHRALLRLLHGQQFLVAGGVEGILQRAPCRIVRLRHRVVLRKHRITAARYTERRRHTNDH